MIKIFLFLILLSPSFVFAEGPILRHKDSFEQQEFDNVYQDLRTKHSFLTQNTSGQILVGQGNGLNPKWYSGAGRAIQYSQFSNTTSTSSTSSTYIDSGLSGSITVQQSASLVEVCISQSVQADAGNALGIKILRDGLTLAGPWVGVVAGETVDGLCYFDTPGSGSHTYKTQFARINGAGTVRCQNNAIITGFSSMMLKEISQ